MINENLEKPIDYNALYELDYNLNKGDGSSITRLRHSFKVNDIKTPKDVLEFCSNPLENMSQYWIERKKEDGSYFKLKNKLNKLDEKEYYLESLKLIRMLGDKNIGLLLNYLESEGFDFSKKHLEQILGSVNK